MQLGVKQNEKKFCIFCYHSMGLKKITMVNCIRFKPIQGCEEDVFRETSKIYETLDGALEKRLVELDDGEYFQALSGTAVDLSGYT